MFKWEHDGLEGFFLAYKQCAWGVLRRLCVKDIFVSFGPWSHGKLLVVNARI